MHGYWMALGRVMGDSWLGWPEPRRMYVTLVWDEAPHQLVLAMVLAALTNPFGMTGAVSFGLCWVAVTGGWRFRECSDI